MNHLAIRHSSLMNYTSSQSSTHLYTRLSSCQYKRFHLLPLIILLSFLISPFVAAAEENFSPELIISEDDLIFTPGEIKSLPVNFGNSANYAGFQVDIEMPEGLVIKSAVLTSTDGASSLPCITDMNLIKDRIYRVISAVNALNGANIATYFPNTILTLDVEASVGFTGGEIRFTNLMATWISDGKKKVTAADKTYKATIPAAPEIQVESITLNKTAFTLKAGDTADLIATVNPSDAADKTLTWTSSDTSVATVSADGKITAVAVGKATITVASTNGKTATCSVVVNPVTADSVSITITSGTTLKVGEALNLSATVSPEPTADKKLSWSSSDAAVATVSADGRVTALTPGTVTITAEYGDAIDTITITVVRLITNLSLNATSISVEKGNNISLSATYSPKDPDNVNLVWNSADESVATVDANGKVTGIEVGETVITVKDIETGLTASCKIKVTELMFGDANNDGRIIIDDVMLIIDYVLERETTGMVVMRADVDGDGVVDIFDVTATLELALLQTPDDVSKAYAAMNTRSPNEVVSIGELGADEDGAIIMPIVMTAPEEYKALQFDMVLPSGWALEEVALSEAVEKTHSVATATHPGGVTRVMVYSLSATVFATDGNLLSLHLLNDYTVDDSDNRFELTNTIGCLENGQGVAISDTSTIIRPMSGIGHISADEDISISVVDCGIRVNAHAGDRIDVYTLTGQTVAKTLSSGDDIISLGKGIYIVVVGGQSSKIRII